ncbi:unnamed protein product [Urochloa decumbens]|uniref:Protein TIFY n=1 Tax=Urochloa decumbens TaxID=240449 RepID=A0ABC8YGV3_9POAL
MAVVDNCNGRRRFAAACGVLSRCVKANQAEALAHNAPTATAASTMLLLPGADVAPDVVVREEAAGAPAPPEQAQLTIMYAGHVLVFDDVPADRAAALMRVAASQQVVVTGETKDKDMPVARKASLQRFMEKRRDRFAAHAPYDADGRPSLASSNKRQQEEDASVWLGLGIPGGRVR